MNSRIQNVCTYLKKNQLDAILISNDTNVTYLCGFPSSESWLLITKTKSYYLTDSRYVLEVKKKLKDIELVCYAKSFYYSILELAKIKRVKVLGFDANHLTVSQFSHLSNVARKSFKIVKTEAVVERFRQIKESKEVRLTRKALSIHKEAHHYLKRIVKPGITESEVLRKLEGFVRVRKCGFSFDPIVASGPNSCYAHASVTDRKIRANDVVLVDMGIDINGYKSDLTRMFFLGKISKLIYDVHSKVAEAQKRAIKSIKPGVKISEIDYQARNYLQKHKLDSYFGHALGHGVGLDIHEFPRISGQNNEILQENMIITIEPGVYLPGRFGVRVEDMVLVTKKGCEILSDDIY